MFTADRELIELLQSAVVDSLRGVSTHGLQRLAGYALCTDDDLSTLYAAWVTNEQVARDAGLLFMPTDWPQTSESEFADISQELRRRSESAPDIGSEFLHYVDSAFATLVAGLGEARHKKLFPPSTFLSVLSTDPSEHLRRLEQSSIEVLNNITIRSAWERFAQK